MWFWDDYITRLNTFPDLQHWYYEQIIYADQDRLILETIGMAFHRPAFTERLSNEHFNDFLQALRDTQAALRTGELVNRESRHVIRKSLGGWRLLANDRWKEMLRHIDSDPQELHSLLIEGMRDGRLQQHFGYLQINDQALGRELDSRRVSCLQRLNHVLIDAGLTAL